MNDTDRPAFRAALAALGPGGLTVADVGARWGAADSWFRLKPLARLVGFEPDAAECHRLNALADPAAERFFPTALGRHDGPGTLHVTNHAGCSSLYPPSETAIRDHPRLRDYMTVTGRVDVRLSRLDTWAAAANEPRLDFLKLDVQGAELDILAGAGPLLDVGVEAEVMFSPLYDGQPLFSDVDAFLRGNGFTFWRFDSLAHYTDHPSADLGKPDSTVYYDDTPAPHPVGSGRLSWANAIYFRERRTLADRRSLLVLAALLEALGDPDGSRCALADSVPLAPRPGRLTERLSRLAGVPADLKRRALITCGCADARDVPKVPGAGEVTTDNGVRVQTMHNGVKVVAGGYHGPWMGTIIEHLDGHHEPQEEKVFDAILRTVRPGSTMVELGAFWAYYSLWFAHAVPDARLILVEPDPENLAVGQHNLALNGRTADVVQASVGRKSLAPRPFACESDGKPRDLPEVCVDDLLDRLNVPRVDVLLADIQGAEVAMLEGSAKAIRAGRVRYVVVSTHHASISLDPHTHEKCVRFVRAHGGHVVADVTPLEAYASDGMVVASFDRADAGMPVIPVSRNGPSTSLYPG